MKYSKYIIIAVIINLLTTTTSCSNKDKTTENSTNDTDNNPVMAESKIKDMLNCHSDKGKFYTFNPDSKTGSCVYPENCDGDDIVIVDPSGAAEIELKKDKKYVYKDGSMMALEKIQKLDDKCYIYAICNNYGIFKDGECKALVQFKHDQPMSEDNRSIAEQCLENQNGHFQLFPDESRLKYDAEKDTEHLCSPITEETKCSKDEFKERAEGSNAILENLDDNNKDLAKFNIKLGHPLLLLDDKTGEVKNNVITAEIPASGKIEMELTDGSTQEVLICEITLGETSAAVEIDESIELENQEHEDED